ncbi:EamA family transporter [Aeromicrobium sp. SMF47]|uniref:EamA family transporter n=1 Tax=Aeromicrobium yanjiei TaxID=2662028 RepID=A0A5Q2MEY1_9ACTN|nr:MULTISPECIES: DMT family transporter [Aeromicrobium]MRJ75323.1 EamA family transporter [Aeromicrobium yanjiei]MRK02618.1 EamA family transporter [Aeromicrobium sp. S22]QGG40221.1 EamA family transporter [Aeromicrobium yanjiei]
MAPLTHDTDVRAASRTTSGVTFAVAGAASFALSGPLAKGLIQAGWTAGAAVTVRVLVAALVLAVPAALTMRGRWGLLRGNVRLIVAYGVIAVAGCQLAYFNAVERMQVGVALLIEFTCPVAVLAWMWWRHGQRPTRLTVMGAVLAIAGLVLVLDLTSGADVDGLGIAWALAAMACAAVYWVLSADEDNGLPGLALAAGGMLFGGVGLVAAGLIGIIPLAASSEDVELAGNLLPWWLVLLVLGVVTAGLAYVLSIAGSRRLGSRLGSFVGLAEAVFGVLFAWLLLSEAPRAVQLAGGALILAGVVAVRLGEPEIQEAPPAGTTP